MATARRMRTGVAATRAAATAPPPAARPAAPRAAVRQEQGRGYVATSVSHGKERYDETHAETEVESTTFAAGEPVARVRLGVGMTISIGQFESLRLDVAVELPSAPDQESLDATAERASEWVADRITDEQTRWLPGGK